MQWGDKESLFRRFAIRGKQEPEQPDISTAIANITDAPDRANGPQGELVVTSCDQYVVNLLRDTYQRNLPGPPYCRPELILVPWYLTEIADEAFENEGCLMTPAVHFMFVSNGRLKRIGDRAFAGQIMDTMTIPYSVTEIGNNAFTGCYLSEIIFETGSQLEGIDYEAFQRCSLQSIDIPDSVTGLGSGVFYNCDSLSYVGIGPNSRLEFLPPAAFSGEELSGEIEYDCQAVGCYSCQISYIFIPDGVKEIEDDCFLGCSDLEKVQFGVNPSIERLGRNVFGCPDIDTDLEDAEWNVAVKLTRIYIPDSVRIIDDGCFSGCPKLSVVSIGRDSQLERIGVSAFTSTCEMIESCKITEIYLPDTLKEIGKKCFAGCANLERVSVGPSFEQAKKGEDAFPESAAIIVRS